MKFIDKFTKEINIVELDVFIVGSTNFPSWLIHSLRTKEILIQAISSVDNQNRWVLITDTEFKTMLSGDYLSKSDTGSIIHTNKRAFELRYKPTE